MKKFKIYEYEKCSTCKNALKFLQKFLSSSEGKACTFEKIQIVESPPSKSELKKMLSFLNGDIRKLFNTSGIMYREMKLSEKLPKMTLDEALDLLSRNGMLVKRPFLISESHGIVGFKESKWKELLEN